MDLEKIKNTVEKWSKHHQIEILKIIKKNSSTINENKSVIYINMSFLSEKTLNEIQQYIIYVQDQEKILTSLECKKEVFKNSFFLEKEKEKEKEKENEYRE
jgi:hypothetical protein